MKAHINIQSQRHSLNHHQQANLPFTITLTDCDWSIKLVTSQYNVWNVTIANLLAERYTFGCKYLGFHTVYRLKLWEFIYSLLYFQAKIWAILRNGQKFG